MKIALLDTVHPSMKLLLEKQGHVVKEYEHLNRNQIIERLQDIDGIVIRSRIKIDREFLEAAYPLKFVARYGAGMENIDLNTAQKLDITCLNAPEGNQQAVAEQAFAMLLSLFNKLPKATAEVKENTWLREENRGDELSGKTVGIIGYGHTGSAFAQVLRGFGVKILAHDTHKTGFGNEWIQEASKQEIQEQAQVISLHLPQAEDTYYYINENFINQCKQAFWLINTARGKCVDTQALLAALESGAIRGACLDVLEYEKSSFESLDQQPEVLQKLLRMPQVMITPHIAGWTHESNEKMAEILVEKISALS
jgi:D-3-phosphoglycerate dehydrogenase